jgi:hypothetical protein
MIRNAKDLVQRPGTKEFIQRYVEDLRQDNAAVFIGAGLSKGAGAVDWAGLLESIAKRFHLDAYKEPNLVALAQYYVNKRPSNRNELSDLLITKFSDLDKFTKNHELLARLPIRTFWTTNYDRLIEKALEANGKKVDKKYRDVDLSRTREGRDVTVYKMHGDIEDAGKAVLTRDDYENYEDVYKLFRQVLAGDLVKKTFLFIGFSFTDPNIDFVLSTVRRALRHNEHPHFVITKKLHPSEFAAKRLTRSAGEAPSEGKHGSHKLKELKEEEQKQYKYGLIRQKLIAKDLSRSNIRTIFVDEYSDITDILSIIEERFRGPTVFISSSALDYGSWNVGVAEDFLHRLAGALIGKNLRITCQFGRAIGNAVVAGAMHAIYAAEKRSVDDQLVLRADPQLVLRTDLSESESATERDSILFRNREELISPAGIAIFLFGNTAGAASCEEMRNEFELVQSRKVYPLPVGASGAVALELWTRVNNDMTRFFGAKAKKISEPFAIIGAPDAGREEVLRALLRIVDSLKE